ncbi:protein kinase family protein [Listeria monocytogenes]|nr:protein kinase family protein [Listeria monocytogenes]
MNMGFFLESKAEELYSISSDNLKDINTSVLYENVQSSDLRYIFSSLHSLFNYYFDSMNMRFKSNNEHYLAHFSRELIKIIEIYHDLIRHCADTEYDFNIDTTYFNHINNYSSFLKPSGGSKIPDNYSPLILKKYEPIFFSANTTFQKKSNDTIILKLIDDSGSYAKVFKYKDSYYNKYIAVKRARKNLTKDEIIRFKNEFNTLKELSSPYIIDVYQFNESKNEYLMEYADDNIFSYISNNPELSKASRKKLILQILEGFAYIHSKKLFHRDISFKNILLKHYDDVSVIKISDFGFVKSKMSLVTNSNTELKGSLNDPSLEYEGFKNYNIVHETYALTKLIIFIMTGKTNLTNVKEKSHLEFMKKGLSTNKSERYQSVYEFKKCFINTDW